MGTEFKPLTMKDGHICEHNGRMIAMMIDDSSNESQFYGRLFATAPEIASLLEEVIGQAIDEFERQIADARQAVPMTGVTRSGPDKLYTTIPAWAQKGLSLLAKIKNEN